MPDAPDADKPADKTTAPPWGEDFDAARAWQTITAQRTAEAELKAKLATLEQAEQARSDADKSELDKAIARAERAEALAKSKAREAILAKADLPDELHAFITADDEDGIAAQVAKLSGVLKGSSKSDDVDPDADADKGTPPANGRPAAGLKPGHGGDDKEPLDLDELVASIR